MAKRKTPNPPGNDDLIGVVSRAARAIAWIEKHCRIPEGKFVGQPVRLDQFQRDMLTAIYDNPSGTRRAILSFGRKNAKTTFAAMLLLLHLVGPEVIRNSQLFSAAQSREQAGILFALAAKIVRLSPTLSPYVGIRDTAKQLHCQAQGTLYRALSAEAATSYGLSPAVIIHDELGQVRGPRSELYDALETAAAAQERPLSIIISTQAPGDNDLLSLLIDDAATGADPHTVLCLYTAPVDDAALDPFSDQAIRLANPAFDSFMNQDEVRAQAQAAKRMPSREAAYRNLVLNQRVEAVAPFVGRSTWQANGEPVPRYAGEPVTAGLDLSGTTDLTSLVLTWTSWATGKVAVLPMFWTPAVGLAERAKADRAPYDLWAKSGHILTTPGASVDYDFVAKWLIEAAERYNFVQIAFDRWRIDQFRQAMSRGGAPQSLVEKLVSFGQGFQSFGPAMDVIERELLNGRLQHGNDPVLTMCASKAIVTRDPAGNRKLDKSKATGRIDGMVALTMARGASAGAAPDETSIDDFLSSPLVV